MDENMSQAEINTVVCPHCRTEIVFLDQSAADAHASRHAKRLSAMISARKALG